MISSRCGANRSTSSALSCSARLISGSCGEGAATACEPRHLRDDEHEGRGRETENFEVHPDALRRIEGDEEIGRAKERIEHDPERVQPTPQGWLDARAMLAE